LALFLFYPTGQVAIINIVNCFGDKNSCGLNGISMNIMKKTTVPVSKIMSELINYSFGVGHFPDELKIVKVCHAFKSGGTNLFTN